MTQHVEPLARTVQDVYALALIQLADQAGQLDVVADELQELGVLLDEQPDLHRLLTSRILSTQQRSEILKRLFENNVSNLIYRFLQVVNAKDRLDLLALIIESYRKLLDQRQGTVEIRAYVASALDDSQVQDLAEKIGAALGQNVLLNQTVDEALIGGLKLRVGDRLIDGSIATQLKLLKQKIIAQGREKTKTQLDQVIA